MQTYQLRELVPQCDFGFSVPVLDNDVNTLTIRSILLLAWNRSGDIDNFPTDAVESFDIHAQRLRNGPFVGLTDASVKLLKLLNEIDVNHSFA